MASWPPETLRALAATAARAATAVVASNHFGRPYDRDSNRHRLQVMPATVAPSVLE